MRVVETLVRIDLVRGQRLIASFVFIGSIFRFKWPPDKPHKRHDITMPTQCDIGGVPGIGALFQPLGELKTGVKICTMALVAEHQPIDAQIDLCSLIGHERKSEADLFAGIFCRIQPTEPIRKSNFGGAK